MSLGLAVEAVKSGNRAVFFTLEYAEKDVLDRFHAIGAEYAQFDGLFEFDCSDAISADYIIKALASAPRGTLVVVDYLQLMSGRGRFENRNQEISTISRGMKLLAKELNVPLLVLSQLNRAPETRQGDHRPQLSDLRESGSIEQDADLVAFIFREEVYRRDREDLRGLAELLVAKQRNGPVGKVDLVFLHSLTKFENRAEDLGDEPQNN